MLPSTELVANCIPLQSNALELQEHEIPLEVIFSHYTFHSHAIQWQHLYSFSLTSWLTLFFRVFFLLLISYFFLITSSTGEKKAPALSLLLTLKECLEFGCSLSIYYCINS